MRVVDEVTFRERPGGPQIDDRMLTEEGATETGTGVDEGL